jgi:ATP-binding cassette subfamily B protein
LNALKYLNKYFSKYKWRILIGLLITVISKLLALQIPIIIRNSLNIVEDYQNGIATDISKVKHELLMNIFIIIGVAVIAGFLTF